MTDPTWIAIMNVLLALLPLAVFVSPTLHELIHFRMVNISLEHGNCDASSLAYAQITMVLGPSFKRPRDGYRFCRMGYDLVERGTLTRYKAKAYVLMAYFVIPWPGDVRDSRAFRRAHFGLLIDCFAGQLCMIAALRGTTPDYPAFEQKRAGARRSRPGICATPASATCAGARTPRSGSSTSATPSCARPAVRRRP